MNRIIINVGSVTYAIKLRKMLMRLGIESRQVKTQSDIYGCMHGIEISRNYLYTAVSIMKQSGINYTITEVHHDIS